MNFDLPWIRLNLVIRQYTIVEVEQVLFRLVNGPFVHQMFPEMYLNCGRAGIRREVLEVEVAGTAAGDPPCAISASVS